MMTLEEAKEEFLRITSYADADFVKHVRLLELDHPEVRGMVLWSKGIEREIQMRLLLKANS